MKVVRKGLARYSLTEVFCGAAAISMNHKKIPRVVAPPPWMKKRAIPICADFSYGTLSASKSMPMKPKTVVRPTKAPHISMLSSDLCHSKETWVQYEPLSVAAFCGCVGANCVSYWQWGKSFLNSELLCHFC